MQPAVTAVSSGEAEERLSREQKSDVKAVAAAESVAGSNVFSEKRTRYGEETILGVYARAPRSSRTCGAYRVKKRGKVSRA